MARSPSGWWVRNSHLDSLIINQGTILRAHSFGKIESIRVQHHRIPTFHFPSTSRSFWRVTEKSAKSQLKISDLVWEGVASVERSTWASFSDAEPFVASRESMAAFRRRSSWSFFFSFLNSAFDFFLGLPGLERIITISSPKTSIKRILCFLGSTEEIKGRGREERGRNLPREVEVKLSQLASLRCDECALVRSPKRSQLALLAHQD